MNTDKQKQEFLSVFIGGYNFLPYALFSGFMTAT
jgi:hypothetical protein